MTVNATDLFERYLYAESEDLDDHLADSLPTLAISEIAFGQTVNFPISNADNVTLAGNVSTSGGSGAGEGSQEAAGVKSTFSFLLTFTVYP